MWLQVLTVPIRYGADQPESPVAELLPSAAPFVHIERFPGLSLLQEFS